MRFRILLILAGAVLAVATWTFPLWYPLLPRDGQVQQELFPGLAPALQSAFSVLPPEQQAAYLALNETEPQRALAMLTSALAPATPAPLEDAELPALVGSVVAAQGGLRGLDVLRNAAGDVTIYQSADGSWLLRMEDFVITRGPDLQVALSIAPDPQTIADLRQGNLDIDLGALKGSSGSQNYPIPAEVNVRDYRSVVIYSSSLSMIYANATLFILSF